MTLNELIVNVESIYPFNLSEKWDNGGYQVSDRNMTVNRILLTIDLTEKVIEKCIEKEVDLIISHHPFIFDPILKIDVTETKGKMIRSLIMNQINCVSFHTNFDQAHHGMNWAISQQLNLEGFSVLVPNDNDPKYGFGGIGVIEKEIDLHSFINFLKAQFNLEGIRVYNGQKKRIHRIAFCGGAGADFIGNAADKGADVYITGDLGHHDGQKAYENDIILIDATHYGLEWVFLPLMEKKLKTINSDLEVFTYDRNDYAFENY
jgi:dinuclear metal center YbgI/SA1388 family protein